MTNLIGLSSTKTLLLVAISTLLASPVLGQKTAARPDRGVMPGASYSVSDIESISLTNGNLNLTIPLASLPPIAGGKLKFTLNAIYNSKLWNVTRTENQMPPLAGCPSWIVNTPQLSDLGGWTFTGGYRIIFRNAHEDFDYVVPPPPGPGESCEGDVGERAQLQNAWYRTILITPDGAEHELRPTDVSAVYSGSRTYLQNYYKDIPNTTNASMRYYSFDGTFIWATINPSSSSTLWTIYLNDGTKVTQLSSGIQRISDSNGNSIKIYSDTNGTHYQDEQTGREIKYGSDGKVWYQTVGGTWESINIVMGTTQVQGKLYQVDDWNPTGGETGGGSPCWHNEVLQTQISVVRQIVFPPTEPGAPGRKFLFNYNSDTTETATNQATWVCGNSPETYTRTVSHGMGALSQMTTPSGAVVSYTYSRDGTHWYPLDSDSIPRETVTQKQVTHDNVTDTWTYNIIESGACGGAVIAPDGSVTTEGCYSSDPAFGGYFGLPGDKVGLVFSSNRSNKEKVERHWSMLTFSGGNTGLSGGSGLSNFNPVVDAEYTSLLDDTTSHNPIKMSARTYQYDYNGNLVQQTDYDWFDPSLVTRDSAGVPMGVPASATVQRVVNSSYYNPATSSTSGNVYAKRALTTATPLILSALQLSTIGPSITQLSYDGQAYGTAPTAGNLTSQSAWDDLDNKWITSSQTYGLYGNLATKTDARGKVTQFFYDDATHAAPNRVVVDPQNGTGQQTTTMAFDYSTGLVASQTDPNGNVSTVDYTNQLLGAVDPFGRPGVAIGPLVNAGGTNQHHRTTTTYFDGARQVVVASDLNSENDKLLKSRTTSDMLGRVVLAEQSEDGTNYTISARKVYEQMGRITYSSNPARSAGTSTEGWTRTTADVLGRIIEVATFGGTAQPPSSGSGGIFTGNVTTSFDANFTTVTDQNGKVRRSMVDGIGRLVRVDEPDASNNLGSSASPVQPTSYTYDVLGNLRTVVQGSQTRTFNYDSLSRLRSAINPENGTINYTYDDNGNLLTKTDARPVTATYSYDALNRNTTVDYSDTTTISPDITRFYDGATNGKGRFWYSYAGGTFSVGNTVEHTAIDSFDALGNPLIQRQLFKTNGSWSSTFQTQRTYSIAGAVTSQIYPSGRTITYTYDNAGRMTGFTGNLGGTQRSYSTGMIYSPTGAMTKEQFGTDTAIYNKLFFNSRGQLSEIRESTSYTGPTDTNWNRGAIINHYSNSCWGMCYNLSSNTSQSMSDNNGNLKKQEVYIPANDQITSYTTWWQGYDYDNLNRLQRVHEYTGTQSLDWQQEYVYDRYGNRTIHQTNTWGAGINKKDFTANAANNNRLGVSAGQTGTMAYDNAGNLTTDSYSQATYAGSGSRVYDAENRMTSAQDANGVWSYYTYNADGQRVRRKVNGVETWQVYGFGGELLAEYAASAAPTNPQKEYGYRNGQLLITAEQPAINVALPSNGGTAVASSTLSPYSSAYVIDGSRRAINSAIWLDSTFATFPDWIEVDFNGSKTISEIDVVTQQDDYQNPVEPTLTQTFSLYGITAFDVQYWNGSTWVTVPNGSITGNNKVWRQFTFSSITTSKIRVVVNAGADNVYSRVVEVEAWTTSGSTTNINWLVTDQLGTPRMVFDKTGALATVKRHDYLPFGEELFANQGARTTTLGYSVPDGVRQKFTRKERDNETGLDYFLARYYSSTQGRFTSPDEFTGGPDELYSFVDDASDNPTFYADLRKPQSLNKYQYANNNPLRWIDPDGHDPEEPEPQDPKPVVAVPVPAGPGGLPLPITLSPTTPGPSDQQIIRGVESVLDTVTYYTGIDRLADWLRPKIWPTPAPAPAPTTTTTPQSQAQPVAPPAPTQFHPKKKQSTGKNKDHPKETERPGRKQPPNYRPFRRPPKKPDPPPPPPKPPVVPKPQIGPDGNPVPPRP